MGGQTGAARPAKRAGTRRVGSVTDEAEDCRPARGDEEGRVGHAGEEARPIAKRAEINRAGPVPREGRGARGGKVAGTQWVGSVTGD
jgi:hypothetical protein